MSTPTYLRYASDNKVRNHMCASQEIAAKVREYIETRYGFSPFEMKTLDEVTMDPGGSVFGFNDKVLECPGLSYKLTVHPSHVGSVLRSNWRAINYGGIATMRTGAIYGLTVIPEEDHAIITKWLTAMLPESSAGADAYRAALADSPHVIVVNPPQIAKS